MPVREFTAEETAELASKYLGECATESEKILVAAAAEKIGQVSESGVKAQGCYFIKSGRT